MNRNTVECIAFNHLRKKKDKRILVTLAKKRKRNYIQI